jgi:predicted O-methyltransferase YrrM
MTTDPEHFVDLCILHLLGRHADPETRRIGCAAYGDGGEAAVVRALAALPEFVAHTCRAAVARKADVWGAGHFHSPVPDADYVLAHWDRLVDRSAHPLPGIDLGEERQLQLVRELGAYMPDLPWRDTPVAGLRYITDNEFFPGGDALLLYAMLRHLRPRRVIEVGSGFSSAAMLDTDERFLASATTFDFIEPYPARLEQFVTADARHRIHRGMVQDVPLELFDGLGARDVLFIDSSHVVKFGSDVLHLLDAVLPRLRAGVVVHFHDIFWPFDYPKQWYTHGRSWNEAYAVRHFLAFNSQFRILLFADWLRATQTALLAAHLPLLPHYPAGSLWLERI